ncbi:MAG: hypothetical protein N2053_06150, partial [Chitinispirillaceae bacterium]|nr:hypothetical protein [Chitinispirillaceae bacterium]
MRRVYLSIICFAFTLNIFATRITNVTVDMIKGYTKIAEGDGDTTYYYMGRATYHLFAEGSDSIYVDFT